MIVSILIFLPLLPQLVIFSMSMITAGDSVLASPYFRFPPPPPPPLKSSMLMLYYCLAFVGTAAILLAIYNIIIVKCCSQRPEGQAAGSPAQTASGSVEVVTSGGGRRQGNQMSGKVSSFKYKKEQKLGCEEEEGNCCRDRECSVCLSDFEDGEEVRQLPRCNHSFHAPCIDMWLYSHSDCPLCRARVEPPPPLPPPLLCQGHTAVVVEGRAVS